MGFWKKDDKKKRDKDSALGWLHGLFGGNKED